VRGRLAPYQEVELRLARTRERRLAVLPALDKNAVTVPATVTSTGRLVPKSGCMRSYKLGFVACRTDTATTGGRA
jgi:hypothetical protein